MRVWVDTEGALWIRQQGRRASRCRDLTKTQMVDICEELSILSPMIRDVPSRRNMLYIVGQYYDFEPRDLDDDMLEFYWEWALVSCEDICQILYDYFCSLNLVGRNCAVDRERAQRTGLLPSIQSAIVEPRQLRRYQPLHLPRIDI